MPIPQESSARSADAVQHIECRVVGVGRAAHNIRVLRLSPDGGSGFTFRAGQYAALRFRDLPPRDYSMANRPAESTLEFHVREEAGGDVSRFVVRDLALGESVQVIGPFGDAYLRTGRTYPIVALAGGTGLAPIKAIIETALSEDPARSIDLYVGARAERDVYLESHLRALERHYPRLSVTIALSEPDGPTLRETGPLPDVVARKATALDGFEAYLAGPPAMVEAATAVMMARGIPRERCYADPFYSEAERQRRAAEGLGPAGRATLR